MRVENSSKWNCGSPWQFLKWPSLVYLAVKNVQQHRNICRDVKVKSRCPHPDGGNLQPQIEMGQSLTTPGEPWLRNEEPRLPRRPAIPFRRVFLVLWILIKIFSGLSMPIPTMTTTTTKTTTTSTTTTVTPPLPPPLPPPPPTMMTTTTTI